MRETGYHARHSSCTVEKINAGISMTVISSPTSDDAAPTLEQLLACGYDAAIAGDAEAYYPNLADQLLAAAGQADSDASRRALRFLVDLCFMRLDPHDVTDPYKPGAIHFSADRRSLVPDDYDADAVQLFGDLAPEVKHPLLRARLADLVWLLGSKRYKFAILATDSYWSWVGRLDLERWHAGQEDCVNRAIQLAQQVRDEDRVALFEAALIAAFDSAPDDGLPIFWFADTMLDYKLGMERAGHIASRLERIGHCRAAASDGHAARLFFGRAGRWFRKSKDSDAVVRTVIATARSYEQQADANAMRVMAIDLYDQAIQIWRELSGPQRARVDGNARITALRVKMTEAGRHAVEEEMHTVRSPGVDVSDLASLTRQRMSGLEGIEALRTFADLFEGANEAGLRHDAEETLNASTTDKVYGSVNLSADGRPVKKVDSAGASAAAELNAVEQKMVTHFLLEVRIIVRGHILPALEVLRYEHNPRRGVFVALAAESALVPRDRVSLVARGLYAGFQGDFVQALHFLSPQLENMVRFHLQRAGADTATHNRAGIVMEDGLSSLAKMPEMDGIFGKDAKFEIWALFCDKSGPNFRNELAHGLVPESTINSDYAVYAWWMMFRMIFNVFWNRQRPSPEQYRTTDDQADDDSSADESSR